MNSQISVQPHAVAVGSTLAAGRYRLLEKLGEGGQGVVFRALEQGGAVYRQVAIKLLKTSAALGTQQGMAKAQRSTGVLQAGDVAASAQQPLRREVGFMASLPTHPHVMQVYHDGSPPDPYFYAMELVPQARSLDCVLRTALKAHRRLDLTEVRHYALAATAGLAHIHAHGLRHGDITLSNLLVSEAPGARQLKIIDFGLARALKGGHPPNSRFAATPAYLAPEALLLDDQHRPLPLDCRSDLFSLGVALYHLATGCLPFATVQATLSQQVQALAPTSHRAMPQALQSVILRLLEKDPAQRYPAAEAVHADLLRIELEGCAAGVQPDTEPRRSTDSGPARRSTAVIPDNRPFQLPRTLAGVGCLATLVLGLTLLVAPRLPLDAARAERQQPYSQPSCAADQRSLAGAGASETPRPPSVAPVPPRLQASAPTHASRKSAAPILSQPRPTAFPSGPAPVQRLSSALPAAYVPFDLAAYQRSVGKACLPPAAQQSAAPYAVAMATVLQPDGRRGVPSAAQAAATSVQADLPFGITVQGRRPIPPGWQLLGRTLCGSGGIQHHRFEWLRNPLDGQLYAVRAEATQPAPRHGERFYGPTTVPLQVHFLAPL
jgi:serine/threonine protein kinase